MQKQFLSQYHENILYFLYYCADKLLACNAGG